MELPKDANLQDLLKTLGLTPEATGNHDWLGRLSLFGAGVLVGAGVALLLTPLANGEAERETEGAPEPA